MTTVSSPTDDAGALNHLAQASAQCSSRARSRAHRQQPGEPSIPSASRKEQSDAPKANIIQVSNDLTCLGVKVAGVLVVCKPPGGAFNVNPNERDLIRGPIESPRSRPTRICDGTSSSHDVNAQVLRGAGDPDRRRRTGIEPSIHEGTSNAQLERVVVRAIW